MAAALLAAAATAQTVCNPGFFVNVALGGCSPCAVQASSTYS